MASKLLVKSLQLQTRFATVKPLTNGPYLPQIQPVRNVGQLIPPNQYDTPFPQKMKLGTLLRRNWEIIPLFAATLTSMGVLFFSIFWAIKNKVDVVFTTHNRENISRTTDLRHPVSHKLFHIKQEYHPWPEMQDSLDKMHAQEAKLRRMASKSAC